MPLETPALEAWFNHYEAGAAHSLGGTMVQPWTGAGLKRFLPSDWGPDDFEFGYVPTPGSLSTRHLVAEELGVGPEAVVLAAGASEANHAVLRGLLTPGWNVVLQDPLYYQFAALAADMGAELRRWPVPADPWEPVDLETLADRIDARTRLVVTNSPHNPTGRVLAAQDLGAIARLVEATPHGYWLSDEIYRGVGIDPAPSALTLSERAIVTGAVSKRWSLPGLRLGWIGARSPILAEIRPYHEHATCCVSRLSEQVIEALWPRRMDLFEANRAIAERNRRTFQEWLGTCGDRLVGGLPPVGVVTLVWPKGGLDDRALARTLRRDQGLFCLPGMTLGYPGALRVGFGHRDHGALVAALESLKEGLGSGYR